MARKSSIKEKTKKGKVLRRILLDKITDMVAGYKWDRATGRNFFFVIEGDESFEYE